MAADDGQQGNLAGGTDEGPAEIELRDAAGTFLETISIDADETISLGRNPDNTVVLDGDDIGRYHLQLQFDGTDLLLIDLGSAGGTLLDGEEVEPHLAEPWDPGMLVRVGGFVMRRNDGFAEPVDEQSGVPAAVVAPLLFVDAESLQQQQLTPGTPSRPAITLRNDSLTPLQAVLELSGLPAEWVSLPPTPLSLEAGTTGIVNLLISVPRSSSATAGDYAVLLRVRPHDNSAPATDLTTIWTVTPFEAIEIDLKPRRATTRTQVDFRIALHNIGNTRSSYKVAARDDSGVLDLVLQPAQVQLEPGRRAEVRMSAQPLEPPTKKVQSRPFAVQAFSALGTASESISGQLMQQRRLPAWIVPLLVMLALLSLIPLVFWLNQREVDAAAASAAASGTVFVTEVPTETPDLTEIETATALAATAFGAQTATAVYDAEDADRDGLANKLELQLGLNPDNADTDGDGLTDAQELNVYRSDPLNPDSDQDGLPDGQEVQSGTNPLSSDTDADGIPDNQDDNSLNLPPPTETPFVPAVAAAQAATRQAQQRAVNAALIEMGAMPEGEAGGTEGGGAAAPGEGGAAETTPTAEATATETPTNEPSPTQTPTATPTMPPNERPILNVPPAVTGGEKDVIEFEDFGIADPDVGAGLMRVSLSVNEGTLELGYSTGLTFFSASQNNASLLDFSATITNVQPALNSLTYQGSGTFNGVDTLNVQISDQGNSGSGGAQTATGSVRITLREENDKPIVGRASMSATEGVTTTITATMLNIVDPDDDAANVQVVINVLPAGTLFLDGDELNVGNGFTKQDIIDGRLSYLSLSGQNSSADSFVFTVDDDEDDTVTPNSGTMLISITGMTPRISGVATRDFFPGAAVTLMPSLSVIDPDGSGLVTMTVSLSNPLNGTAEQLILSSGAITGGLVADNSGTVITLRPQTGRTAALAAYLTTARQIAYNNTAGTLDRSAPRRLTLAVRDDSGLIATADFDVLIDDPIQLSAAGLPATNEDTLSAALGSSVVISDSNISSSGQIRLSLGLNNAQPRIVNSSVVTGPIVSGDVYSYTQLVTGTLSNLNNALQTMQIMPDSNFFGSVDLAFSVTDLTSGSAAVSASRSTTMTVTAVNDEPTFSMPADISCNEDTGCTVTISSILAGPANERSGIGAQTVSFSAAFSDTEVISAPDTSGYNGVAGSFTFALPLNTDASGVRQLEITATDSGSGSAPNDNISLQTITVTVVNINDRPTFSGDVNALPTLGEDAAAPSGTTDGHPVSALFRAASEFEAATVSDPDNNSFGIALSSYDALLAGRSGNWYYLLNGSSSWTAFPTVNSSALLLLGPDDRIAYVPPADAAGTISAALTFHAWDRSSGTAGSQVPFVNSASAPLSADTRSAALAVSAVNDLPQLRFLDDVSFNETDVFGQSQQIDTLVEVSDIDSADFLGGGITATWTAGGTSADQLAIVNGARVTLSGTDVALDGITVAQIPAANGSNGSDLYLALTAALDSESVELLIEAIGYRTVSQNPALTRTLGIAISDGDGGLSLQQTATITVTPVNSAPTISGVSNQTINEDAGAQSFSFTVGDAEDDASLLTASAAAADSSLITADGISVSGSGITRTLTVTPTADLFGSTAITITVSDSEGAAQTAALTLTVAPINDAPTLTAPVSTSYPENTTPLVLTVSGISAGPANERLISGQTVTITAVSANPAVIPNPSVNYDGVSSEAVLTLLPVADAAGVVTFTVTATDSGSGVPPNSNSVAASFVITLTNVNNAPVLTGSGNPLSPISEDQPAPSGSAGTVVSTLLGGKATDADGTTSFGIAVSAVEGGNWYFSSDSGSSWTAFPAVSGSNALLLAPTDRVALQPTADFSGTVSSALTYHAWDQSSGTAGGVTAVSYSADGPYSSGSTSSSITVVGVNDAPRISNLNGVTFSETDVFNTLRVIDSSVGFSDSDSGDLDDGELLLSLTAGGTATDQLSIVSGVDIQRSGDTIFFANTTIIGRITDGTRNGTNGSDLLISLEPGATPIRVRALIEALGYATTSTTPALTRTLALTVSDGDGATSLPATAVITVTPVNSAPTISAIADQTIAEDGTRNVSFTIADIDNADSELSVSVSSSNPTLLPAGSLVPGASGSVTDTLSITPTLNGFGSAAITLTVTDSYSPPASTSTSFTLTVTAVNDAPTITTTVDLSEGLRQLPDTPATLELQIADVESGTALTTTLASSNTTLVPLSNLVLSGSGITRTLTITPTAGPVGSSVITVSVSDGVAAAELVFTVYFNGPPQILGDAIDGRISPQYAEKDELLVMDWAFGAGDPADAVFPPNTDFLIINADQALAELSVTAVSTNTTVLANSAISFGSNTLVLTPTSTGVAGVRVRVFDGIGTTTKTFLLQVGNNGTNNAPTVGGTLSLTVTEDTSGTFNLTLNDDRTARTALNVRATSLTTNLLPQANLLLSGNGNRSLQVTPTADLSGSAYISVTASDGAITSTTRLTLTVTSLNDLPTISAIDDATLSEDSSIGPLSFTVSDLETAAADLTLSGASSDTAVIPVSGIVFGGSGTNRTVSLTPAADASGTVTVTVGVNDGSDTVSTTFTVTILPTADPPVISGLGNITVLEDVAPVPREVIISDAETAADQLQIAISSSNTALVAANAVTLTGTTITRTLLITPTANASGTTVISVTATDGDGMSTSRSFALTVLAVNDLPTIAAVADQTINEDTQLTLSVAVSDIETAAGSLVVSAASSDENVIAAGDISIGAISAGSVPITITPQADVSGSSTITLTVSDGSGGTAGSTFLLTVNAVNDLPTVSAIGSQTINEDQSTGALTFIIGDLETATISLTLLKDSSNTALVPLSGIVFGGSSGDVTRTVTITPTANASGSSLISIGVNDGSTIVTTTFTLTVSPLNDAPTVGFIAAQSVNEDGVFGPLEFSVNDIEDGGNLTVTVSVVDSPSSLIEPANVVLAGSGITRTLTITPTAGNAGTATVQLSVSDSSGTTTTRSFLLTVNQVNDPPTIASIADQTIDEDTQLTLSAAISDVETTASSLVVSAVSSDENVIAAGDISIGAVSAGSVPITITPQADVTGSSTITLTVSDGSGGSADSSFLLTVNALNDAPTVTAIGSQTINEDQSTGALTFIVGDVDSAVSSLTLLKDSSNTALVPLSGIVFGGSGDVTRTVTITPTANASGSSLISIGVNDGSTIVTTTFTLTVNPLNDAPTVGFIAAQSVNEDGVFGPLEFSVNDIEDGGNLTVTVSTISADPDLIAAATVDGSGITRTLTITPTADKSGTALVALQVSDSGGITTTRSFYLDVNEINDLPTITAVADRTIDEDSQLILSVVISDIETTAGNLQLTKAVDNQTLIPLDNITRGDYSGIISATVPITVTPAANQSGTATFTITVTDANGGSVEQGINISVLAVNDAPTISAIASRSINEDGSTGPISFDIGDIDSDVSTLTLNKFSSNPTLAPIGSITFGGSGTARTLTITPTANLSGAANITVTVSDGSNTTSESFILTVNPVNDQPLIGYIGPQSVQENTVFGPLAITVNDLEDSGNLTVTHSIAADPANLLASSTLTGTGNTRFLTVTPANNKVGTATVTITATDSGGLSFARSFVLSVLAEPDIVTLESVTSSYTTLEDVPEEFEVLLTATAGVTATTIVTETSDPALLGNVVVGPISGDITATVLITVTPGSNLAGSGVITLTASDGVSSFQLPITINVTAVNDAPTGLNLTPSSVAAGSPAGTSVGTLSSTDVDSSVFTYSLVSGTGDTDNGRFAIVDDELQTDEELTTPTSYSVRIQTMDGDGLTYSTVVIVTVEPT
jgi:hypothetical protein